MSDITGPVRVVDADTLWVGATKVRLFGIDAAELDQTCETEQGTTFQCGQWVHDQTHKRFAHRIARCEALDTDRYGRTVARCWVGDIDIGRALVQDGLAFAFRRYSMDYDLDEKQAAVMDRGLHGFRVQSPSQFRVTRATGRIPIDPACKIKGNISANGRIFHVPGQEFYERTGINMAKGERWFCSGDDARAAGWRAAKR
ncbi:MAG: thermonuclease family protein [Pseudomonadota bacterium]